MNKNLLKSKIEMASLIEKQQSEIEDLSSINRDLMIHLEAAQKINNQEKFIWESADKVGCLMVLISIHTVLPHREKLTPLYLGRIMNFE